MSASLSSSTHDQSSEIGSMVGGTLCIRVGSPSPSISTLDTFMSELADKELGDSIFVAESDDENFDGINSEQYKQLESMHVGQERRDYLMWCPDKEFDRQVEVLDMRGLVELVQTLQDAMAVEQQTFDSLSKQLNMVYDPIQQQRLSAALCTSQTRLARLCSRNMRAFTQQALQAKQADGVGSTIPLLSPGSRSSSPRDSGLAISSTAGSDLETDLRSPDLDMKSPYYSPGGRPSSTSGATFRNSLAFFQKAANIVTNNAKSRERESRPRSSGRGSSSTISETWSVNSDDFLAGSLPADDGDFDDYLCKLDDANTYEQVLFINGRPQYFDDVRRSHSCDALDSRSTTSSTNGSTTIRVNQDSRQRHRQSSPSNERSRSCSWSRMPSDGATNGHNWGQNSASVSVPQSTSSQSHGQYIYDTPPSRSVRRSVPDIDSYVTLPRRKPYLNFTSVNTNDDLSECRNSANSNISRAQSFKEGLDVNDSKSNIYNNKVYTLSRTRSCNDGLAGDLSDTENRTKLVRVPSVDEILESVKSLRAKKNMVKSNPDLLSSQEPVYHTASLPKHKSKSSKSSSSLLGVRYNGHSSSSDKLYDRSSEPDYEQIPEGEAPYYENLGQRNFYENLQTGSEVIYDSPRSSKDRHYDKVTGDLVYENLNYDPPVYENVNENEPTYMNVKHPKSSKHDNIYANLDEKPNKSHKSKARGKVTITGNSTMSGQTYDVPRAATHIYDTPPKQTRQVNPKYSPENEYDTPKNNRSVLPQSTQIVLKAQNEQQRKIDDIFADCDKDSLEGDRDREPDIPSPDYGSDEESCIVEEFSNSEYPDEGLGESDSRSFYTEDQGLEVILEEPEEEYCSSSTSEDDIQLKVERRSLDGSEGIGSAEGDSHSSGGSDHYIEEDCASSGIHSEDTPSPGPPVEPEKEDALTERNRKEKEKEKDRCIEVYPETVRQRQRNMAPSPNKVDIKNWSSNSESSPTKTKKFLPSVKALRSQFESGKNSNNSQTITSGRHGSLTSSTNSINSSSLEKTSSTNSLNSHGGSTDNILDFDESRASSAIPDYERESQLIDVDEPVEPIFNQFRKVDEELRELMSKPPSTSGWNPRSLLKKLYYIPDVPKSQSLSANYVNIEGYLEKLPSGRKKATFWNAWKRRYFVAKDGVLYYYQNNQAEKPSMKLTLMGGKVETMESNMVGVDDGKGHFVVVRCSSRQEAERWRKALETHTVEDFVSQYVQPWPIPKNPSLLRDTIIIDLGSSNIRAGILASQATLPQIFYPTVLATERKTQRQTWGFEALSPDVRTSSSLSFPIRPSHKISKYSVDLSAVSSLLQKTFMDLKVDPKNYNVQLSVPRILNTNTQTELLRILFEKYGVKSVNLTHQSILALYAYNATSGIVVDIGERMDIVPVIDGYIVDGGVSRVPYGGYRILDHLRQFLYMRNVSLINHVDSFLIRQVLENICYCAHHYNTEKARCCNNSDNFEKSFSLKEFFQDNCPYESISLDFGRFQATEGIFNPDAWGLDHPGLHKLVYKAIQECSMDIRKEMSRSVFLAGGVTQLPGFIDRLTTEIDNLTPPAIRPKVHGSPYRYHAAYLGACVLAESPAFVQSRISREDWLKQGTSTLRKWSM